MKKLTHLFLIGVVLTIVGSFAACNTDKKKLEDKDRELSELRQLAELDKKEMENQYAEFASQYGELKKASKMIRLSTDLIKNKHVLKHCLRNCKTPKPIARLKYYD